jgi:hypothetical protein
MIEDEACQRAAPGSLGGVMVPDGVTIFMAARTTQAAMLGRVDLNARLVEQMAAQQQLRGMT